MCLSHSPTGGLSSAARQPSTSAERICHSVAGCVADAFGLNAAEMMSRTRGAPRAAFARQVAMYLAHVEFALSFEMIGRVFDRDRTTVAHACRVVEDNRDDARLDHRLAALELVCRGIQDECRGASDAGI